MIIKFISKKVKNNNSFVFIVLSALFGMLSTLFVKNYYPNIFNSYSLYITYIGIVSSFGFLGFEQLFLRLGKREKDFIFIEKRLYILMFLSGFLFPIISLTTFGDNKNYNFIFLLITGWSINLIIFSYNLFRLKEFFSYSQLFKSSYRIIFFIIIVTFFFFKININIFYAFSIILSILGVIALFFIFKYIRIDNNKSLNFYKLYVSFLFNIGLITLLGFGERLLIKNNIGEDAFGKYFYYITIFIFPLTLIQQYVGFKELVYFKKTIIKKQVINKIKIIVILGLAITFLTIVVVIIDNGQFLDVDLVKDKAIIFALFILGLIKLIYGLFSAILGAVGEYKDLIKLNFITFIILLCSILYLKVFGYIIVNIIYCLTVVFSVRTVFIYFRYVK